jgi:exopolyphosphatase/guanosine-5'-triphosphate,3'-diphosphate pyrophosphatase
MADLAPEPQHALPDPPPETATARPRAAWPVFGALDLGTNNCRLLLATPGQAGPRVVESFSRAVRLGEGLAATGVLSDAAMTRAIEALAACASRLQRRPVRRLRAVATEACRRASNGAAFVARAEAETGIALSIINTREEAELAVESCLTLLAQDPAQAERRAVLFDIGGGSTEVAFVRLSPVQPPFIIGYTSLPAGVIALAEKFGLQPATVPDSQAYFAAMVDYVLGLLAPFESVHRITQEVAQGGVRLLGTSGTATTLAGVALDLPCYRRAWVDGVTLESEVADDALARILSLTPEGIVAHPCIGPDRAEFVLPGCAVYAAIRTLWPAPRITVADRGLREGILLRLMRDETTRRGR